MSHTSGIRTVSDGHLLPMESTSPSASNLPHIFRLPRELRDIIYDYYIRCDGGYIFDSETRRFMQTNGEPVCYALAFTCKQAASELEGLPFQLNALTFSSTNSTSTYEKAGLQHHVALMLRYSKQVLLEQLLKKSKLFTRPMAQAAAKSYPQFAGLIDEWVRRGHSYTHGEYKDSYGEARSSWDDFVEHILDLMSECPDYAETVKDLPDRVVRWPLRGCHDLLRLRDADLRPWRILDHAELERLSDMLPSFLETERPHENTCYNYSAAAVALQFLASCTKNIRSFVRKIILKENNVSVAQPECHSRGFIPICQENRSLRIERHVNLWKAVFLVSRRGQYDIRKYITAAESDQDSSDFRGDRLRAYNVTKSIGKWVTEVMALQSLGMPEGSHTLVLDGDPIPNHTANVFRIVQRDAAWQAALDICYSLDVFAFNPSWLNRRLHQAFAFSGLPEMIRTLSTDSAPVRCNFTLHSPFDLDSEVQELLERSGNLSGHNHQWRWAKDWGTRWIRHNPLEFQTEAPLPPWHMLCWRHVLPQIPPTSLRR